MVYVIINPPNLQLLVWVRINKDRTIVNLIIDGEITLIYDMGVATRSLLT